MAILVLGLFAGLSRAELEEPQYFKIEFTIVRTFDAPVRVSIVGKKREPKAQIKAEIYSGKGGYEWGEVESVIEKDITKKTFLELYERASKLNFDQIFKSADLVGLDGSTWILKIDKGGSTISLSIWSPTYKDTIRERNLVDFVAFGKHLLALSEINISENELY